jgi:hypothetical protein
MKKAKPGITWLIGDALQSLAPPPPEDRHRFDHIPSTPSHPNPKCQREEVPPDLREIHAINANATHVYERQTED